VEHRSYYSHALLGYILLAVLLLAGCAMPLVAESGVQAPASAVLPSPTSHQRAGVAVASDAPTGTVASPLALPSATAQPTPLAGGQFITASLGMTVPTSTAEQAASSQPASPLRLPTPTPVLPAPPGLPTPTAQPAPILPVPTPTPRIEPTPDAVVRTARVPILMYHYLSTPPPDADIYRRDLSVSPELFAAHLDAMQAAGYTAISLYDLLAHLTQGAPLPDKPVILTFDDGYRDNFEHALPLLQERGMAATFFVVTDFIDEQRPAYLTWDMVRAMHAAGMAIEAHGRNHVTLQGQDEDYLVWQALGTFEAIEREVGVRPRFVSYPAGEYDQRTIDIFRSANYWAGLTTVQGATHRSDDLFRLHRVRVRGTTTPEELLRLLALDW
jgi:peptidoglycan/xylan/chitin deacetylase (PgdA/CDA1 family)